MSIIEIKVIPNAKKDEIVETHEGLKVKTHAPATDGKANKAVINIIAGYLGVKSSQIKIIRGERSRKKVLEIDDLDRLG